MKASFDSKELLASLPELERPAREHGPATPLAAIPSAQLSIDLAALLTSAKSGSAPKAVAVEDPARLPPPDEAAASRSATINLAPDKDLHPSAAGKKSASLRPRRWIYAAAAIVIVMGSLVGVAGYLASSNVLMALQALRAPREFDPPLETTAQVPAAEQTADDEPATPAAAEQTASAAAPGRETPPALEAPPVASGVKASAEQPAQADVMTPPALVAQPPAAAATPPAAAKKLAAIDRFAPAATPSKPEAPVAETTKPVKKAKKASADKSQTRETGTERHAKSKPARIAKPRGTPGAAVTPDNVNAEPAVISDARRVTQTINGIIQGWVGADPHDLR